MKNDKCDLCALKVIFDQDSLEKERDIEKYFDTLRQLQKDEIIEKGYERRAFVGNGHGDQSEMCAVNSKFFLQDNKDKKCPEFILNMNLSVPDALSLNLSKKHLTLASEMESLTRESLSLTITMKSLTKKSITLATKMNCLTWALVVLTIVLLFLGMLPFIQNTTVPKQNPLIIEQNINKATERSQQHTKINSVTNLKNERHK